MDVTQFREKPWGCRATGEINGRERSAGLRAEPAQGPGGEPGLKPDVKATSEAKIRADAAVR